MIIFFLTPSNIPFVIALIVTLAFTVMEIISVNIGMGLSEMVDSLIPEFDADIDISGNGGPGDSLIKLLVWLRVGEVPSIPFFIVFLTGFWLSGLTVQFMSATLTGKTLPTVIAVILALLCAASVARSCGGLLDKYYEKFYWRLES